MAPAMSMRCITVPPRMNPSGLASFGRTTCTISVADSAARFGSARPWISKASLTASGPRVEPSIVLAFGVDERLQREAQLRRQLLLTERPQERHRALIAPQLRDAARTPRQVLLQLLLQAWGQLAFQVVRKQPDDRPAAAPHDPESLLRPYAFLRSFELEVVADPHRKLRLPEPVAAAGVAVEQCLVRIEDVFVVLVEQRPPRPVEVDREAERERLEADAVRGAAVDEAEAADVPRRPVDRRRALDRVRVGDEADHRRARGRRRRPDIERLVVEAGGAETGERHRTQPADDAERRERRL